ncbi:MAG: choice-of-anchor E domain-containing protein [Methylococcaceae bacterium]
MKKILAITAIATAGLFAGNASAASITYDFNSISSAAHGAGYTLARTNWTAMLSLPKFSLPGKILDSAVLTYGGDFMSTGAIDSEDATAIEPAISFVSNVELDFFGDGSNGSSNIGLNNSLAMSSTLFNGTLGADDEIGNADFAGDDSSTGLITGSANDGNIFNIADLASVQGLGKFKVYSTATGGWSINGSANLATDITTSARGQIAITYNYHDAPQQASSVPEPEALVLMSMGITGFSVLRKRKYSLV